MLAATAAILRLAGYPRCRRWLERRRGERAATAAELESARAWERAFRRASGGLPRARCLERSLALCWLLRRRGIGAELRLGVRRDRGDLAAHAWVEVGGRSLDGASTRFAAFAAAGPG